MKLTAVKKLPIDKKWFSLIPILLIGVLIITVNLLSTFSVTEYRIASHLKKLTTAQDYTDKLVVIEYKPKVITRIEIAGLIQTLADANARSILLDLNLSKASLVEIDDYILSQTLKANKKIKVILPIYTNGDQALEPLPSFSKHTALGYVDLQSDVNHQSMPIQLRSNTAASEYPHAVLLQLGNQRSDNLSTLIEPRINTASIYRLPFSETIKNSNNKRFAHKDILIGPNTKRTTIHALLYKTLMHGEVKAVPQYINFAIFLILSLFLVNLFAKNDDRMHIIFISSCIAILPLISSLASIVFLRALIPAFSLTTGIILVILYLSYFHKAKLLSNYTNRIDLSEHDNGLFEGELLIGKNGDISIANPIVTLLLGYKNRNLNGTPIHIIIPSLNQEKWADFYNKLHKTEAPDEHIYDFIAKKPNGKEMKIQLQPKCFTGANTSFIQFIFRDICKYSNKNYVALEYLAKYDEVSKTLNKLGIMEYLSNEINISNNASFISVIILHIENFSVISNSLGKKHVT